MSFLGLAAPFTMAAAAAACNTSAQFGSDGGDYSSSSSSSSSASSSASSSSTPLPSPTSSPQRMTPPKSPRVKESGGAVKSNTHHSNSRSPPSRKPSRLTSNDVAAAEESAAATAAAAAVAARGGSPIIPPANSFASAQAAMAAQNSSHTQNLIGRMIDNSRPGGPISHLEFISVLGLGAYGIVHLARDVAAAPSLFPTARAHPELGNQPLYAVKCLNKVGLDKRQRSFQQREIRLHHYASQHSNVVTLHNVIEEPTCIYVVLQFCEEGDLFGMITERQRYLGHDNLIRDVFLQIVDAIQYCHDRNIYHRDLKPENILCMDDGRKVVLADFGLATSEKESGDFGCGSTFYMSPECQGGLFQRLNSYSTGANDIWSLGVILVNLTCGRNPWKQACPSDETFCAYLGNPDFLRSILPISDHTNRILKRIFALNPAVRIGLKELREEILKVKTFVMTEEELKHATKATKDAARAFAGDCQETDDYPEEEEAGGEEEDDLQVDFVEAAEHDEDGGAQFASSWIPLAVRAEEQHSQKPLAGAGAPPSGVASPITPPATPRRPTRPAEVVPSTLYNPATSGSTSHRLTEAALSSSSDTLMAPCHSNTSDESSASGSKTEDDVFTTPPQQARSVFNHTLDFLPPSPVTPTYRRPTRSSNNNNCRSPSPLEAGGGATPKAALANRRGGAGPTTTTANHSTRRATRKNSVDSSSSSSGTSSMPPTPTGPPCYTTRPEPRVCPHPTSEYPLEEDMSCMMEDEQLQLQQQQHHHHHEQQELHQQEPKSYTAYYPLFADWADAAASQQTQYNVTLPPPVFLPPLSASGVHHSHQQQGGRRSLSSSSSSGSRSKTRSDHHDSIPNHDNVGQNFDFPMPPVVLGTGYYHPLPTPIEPMCGVQDS